tara:strand:+ start:633 stop:977 length:345 start_codon:yes stop_codon:yes gene_type:complete
MDEKMDVELQEATPISPLSAIKPGERIPVPGTQRPLEDRGLDQGLDVLADVISLVDTKFQKLVDSVGTRDHNGRMFMPPEVAELAVAIKRLSTAHTRLNNLMGDDPNAPRLEEE